MRDAKHGLIAIVIGAALALLVPHTTAQPSQSGEPQAHAFLPMRGVNVVAVPGHPFGSGSARRALVAVKRLGADTVAIIPFLWQATPSSAVIERGSDMPDSVLRVAIREARAVGLKVVVKPHVWVPQRWAGVVEAPSEEAWRKWFAAYRGALDRIAAIAAEEKADMLAVGTELSKTVARPEWTEVIAGARRIFTGPLIYVAHDLAEAEVVPFWERLDAIGISLYPPLGTDADRDGRLAVMRNAVARLETLAGGIGKPVLVAEIGLRSAEGATAKPWESAEEREAPANPVLQAQVLADWLSVLDRPAIRGVLVWRWFSDPDAGGPNDTDFTVQRKPAEGVLLCAWTAACRFTRSESIPGSKQ